jgi:hypothetical protein
MALALKNGFVHVADAPVALRRTKSCEIAALATYELVPLELKGFKASNSIDLASTEAGSDTQSTVGDSSPKRAVPTFSKTKNTVVFKGFPVTMTQRRFVNILKQAGFEACFDVVHMPLNPDTWMPKGYAFVRFLDDDFAQQAIDHFDGLAPFGPSPKTLSVQAGKHSLKVKNLVAAADADVNSPPEMHPMIFDAETGMELQLPTKAARKWSSAVADRA